MDLFVKRLATELNKNKNGDKTKSFFFFPPVTAAHRSRSGAGVWPVGSCQVDTEPEGINASCGAQPQNQLHVE